MERFTTPGVSDYGEHELVDKILDDPFLSLRLFEALNVDNATEPLRRVPFSSFPTESETKGDVDLLLLPHLDFAQSIAIEVKRVKVSQKGLAEGAPNKLSGIGKGALQTDKLVVLGFSRVYLLVFVVVDARAADVPGSPWLKSITPDIGKKIDSVIHLGQLSAAAGFLQIELVQPVDKDITDAGAIGYFLRKEAAHREQPLSLTHQIERAFRGRK